MKILILLIFAALTVSQAALAFEYEAPLPDAAQEKLAHKIFTQVRCLVCSGESLAASNADFSVDMRALIREQIVAGKNQEQVLLFLTERYGASILQEPPKTGGSLVLWLLPIIFLLSGVIIILKKAFR